MEDYLFQIEPTIQPEKLKQMQDDFYSLPYKQQKLSNDECIKKYGVTNDKMFRVLSHISKEREDIEEDPIASDIISEAFELDNCDEGDIFLEKIKKAEIAERNGAIIITPYNIEFGNIYSLDLLEKKYNDYLSSSSDIKNLSDQESIALFGDTIYNMYHKNKIKILAGEEEDHIDTIEKSDIENYRDSIDESDSLGVLMHKMDMLSLYENTDNFVEQIYANEIYHKDYTYTLENRIPPICPYFTPKEIIKYGSGKRTPFFTKYEIACSTCLEDFDYGEEFHRVKELYGLNTEEAVQEMIDLGWNPSVEPTLENLKIAKDRLYSYFKEESKIEIIDLSKMNVHEDADVELVTRNLEPVFIVLSFTNTIMGRMINRVKKGNYSHAAISFESDLQHLYSFNLHGTKKGGGISYESINDYLKVYKDARIKVMAVFVTENQKARIHAKLDYYIANYKSTNYDFMNLLNILFNRKTGTEYDLHMVCSQFVDSLLRAINIDITGKHNNLVSPSDFEKTEDKKVYTLYEGKVKDYNKKRVDLLVRSISVDRASQYKIIQLEAAIDIMFKYRDPLLYKVIKISEESGNKILEEINSLITPTSIFREAKSPLRFDQGGNLEVDFLFHIEAEYQQSHKLLLEYDKVHNYEGMKMELAKLWYINNVLEYRINNPLSISKQKLTNQRARVLNDFKKYIGKVLKNEPSFNFTEYFEKSQYYDKTITIDASTLKYTGKILKQIIGR